MAILPLTEVKPKACRRNQSFAQSAIFADFFWGRGEEQEALALIRKKGGREGSIEGQLKFDTPLTHI